MGKLWAILGNGRECWRGPPVGTGVYQCSLVGAGEGECTLHTCGTEAERGRGGWLVLLEAGMGGKTGKMVKNGGNGGRERGNQGKMEGNGGRSRAKMRESREKWGEKKRKKGGNGGKFEKTRKKWEEGGNQGKMGEWGNKRGQRWGNGKNGGNR